jgi:hypothetical protein
MRRALKRRMASAIHWVTHCPLGHMTDRRTLRTRLASKYHRYVRLYNARMNRRYRAYHYFRPYYAANAYIRSKQ